MTPTANSALVARAQAGDRDAFGELVSRYGGLVHGLCKAMAGSTWDAQDLAHDAFDEAWLKLPSPVDFSMACRSCRPTIGSPLLSIIGKIFRTRKLLPSST